MHILVAIAATLALLPWLATPSQASERTVARMGGLQATISQTAQWCGETVEIRVHAPDPAQLSGDDTRQLQLLAGGVRQILGLECPAIQQLQLIGSVHGQTIGTWTHTAEGQLIAAQAATPPASPVQRTQIGREEIAEAQQMLSELGYEPGPVDGLMGRQTRSAITAFQRDRRQAASGHLTPELLGQLRHDYCGNALICDGPDQAATDTTTSSARVAVQQTTVTDERHVSEPSEHAMAHELSFDTLPEPDHQAMLRLYMAANRDRLDNEVFASEYYRVFHVEPGNERGRPSDQCRELYQRMNANEFELQRVKNQFRESLQQGLSEASAWPEKSLFRLETPYSLPPYNHEQQGFMMTDNRRPLLFGGEFLIRHHRGQRGRNIYQGPITDHCTLIRNRDLTAPGRNTAPSSYSLVIAEDEALDRLPMTPQQAEAHLQSLDRGRGVILETIVEAGPSSLASSSMQRLQVPARTLAARVLHPQTREVLHVFELAPPAPTEPEPLPEAELDIAAESIAEELPHLSRYHLSKLLLHHAPELLTDDILFSITERQIAHEQHCYTAINETSQHPMRSQSLRLNPSLPVITLSWQEVLSRDDSAGKQTLIELFDSPSPDWSFLTHWPDYDVQYGHLIDAFIFSSDAILERDRRFAARELSTVFQQHLEAVTSEQGPLRVQASYRLPAVDYDFSIDALRFKQDNRDHFIESTSLIPLASIRGLEREEHLYEPFPRAHITEPFSTTSPGGDYACKQNSPSHHWRQRLADLSGSGLARPVLALSHDLRLTHLPMAVEEAERLLVELDRRGLGLQANVTLRLNSVEIVDDGTNVTALYLGVPEEIAIRTPSGRVISTLQPAPSEPLTATTDVQAEQKRPHVATADPATINDQTDADPRDSLGLQYLPEDVELPLPDSRSRDVIASLELEEPPLPLQTEAAPSEETTTTTEAYDLHTASEGPDILGIHLGMSFEEAESLIQAHMDVGLEAVADRKWQTGAAIGNIALLNSARLFLSSDQRESIILYDEPPAAEGIVMGVARQVLLPADTIPPSTIIDELQKNYGPPDVVDNSMLGEGLMIWGDASVFTRHMSHRVVQDCLPISTNKHLNRGWRHMDDSPFGVAQLEQRSRQPFSALTPITHIQMEEVTRLAETCEGGKAVAAIFSPTRHPHRQGITVYDTLNIWLFDLSTYAKTYLASLQQQEAKTAEATDQEVNETSGSGIRF